MAPDMPAKHRLQDLQLDGGQLMVVELFTLSKSALFNPTVSRTYGRRSHYFGQVNENLVLNVQQARGRGQGLKISQL